jgi:PKD repeat protein
MKKMRSTLHYLMVITVIGLTLFSIACTETEEPDAAPIASFQFAVDENDFLKVTFTSFSQNATKYSWDFGDASAASTVESPTYTYAEAKEYTVTLTVTNDAGVSASKSEKVTLSDPDKQLTLLAGTTSKTWKLKRDGIAFGLGGNAEAWTGYFSFGNTGARPCFFDDEFIFSRNGSYDYTHANTFWGEGDVWTSDTDRASLKEVCFEPTTSNMTVNGTDLSAWLGGNDMTFVYEPTKNKITLNGTGVWMGLVKLGTDAGVVVPQSSISFEAIVKDGTTSGVDTLEVNFNHTASGLYWRAIYVSYADISKEPAIVTEAPKFGVDLADITPTSMSHTFASTTDFVLLGTLGGGSIITPGVDDPANASGAKVGKFDRVATDYQEAQIRVSPDPKDINFSSLSTISIEVYLPSSNVYTGSLTKNVELGLADQSATEQWWTDIYKYTTNDLELDKWITLTYTIATPTSVATAGTTPKTRTDLDMFYINIGGAGHKDAGVFYVRNLKFQ